MAQSRSRRTKYEKLLGPRQGQSGPPDAKAARRRPPALGRLRRSIASSSSVSTQAPGRKSPAEGRRREARPLAPSRPSAASRCRPRRRRSAAAPSSSTRVPSRRAWPPTAGPRRRSRAGWRRTPTWLCVPPGGGKKLRSVLEVARAAYPEFLAGGGDAAATPSSPRPDTSGDEALARRFAARAPRGPEIAGRQARRQAEEGAPDTSGDEELARPTGRGGAAAAAPAAAKPAVKPRPEAEAQGQERRTVVESEDDDSDDDEPSAARAAAGEPPSDEGDDLYDDENDEAEDDDETTRPLAPAGAARGRPALQGRRLVGDAWRRCTRHVAEALEAAAEAPAARARAWRGRAASRRRPEGSAEAPIGRLRPPTAAREAYGSNGRSLRGRANAAGAPLPRRQAGLGAGRAVPARAGGGRLTAGRPSRSRRARHGGGGRLRRQPPADGRDEALAPRAAAGGWPRSRPSTRRDESRTAAAAGAVARPAKRPRVAVASATPRQKAIVVDNLKVKFLIGKGGATRKGIPTAPARTSASRTGRTRSTLVLASSAAAKPVRTITIRGPTEEAVGAAARVDRIHPEPAARGVSNLGVAAGWARRRLCFALRPAPPRARLPAAAAPGLRPVHRDGGAPQGFSRAPELGGSARRDASCPSARAPRRREGRPRWSPPRPRPRLQQALVVDNSKVGLDHWEGRPDAQGHPGVLCAR